MNIIRSIFKSILLGLPIIYSFIRIKTDPRFYIIVSIIFFIIILLYNIFKNKNFLSYCIQIGISFIFLDLILHNIDHKQFLNAFGLIDLKITLLIIGTIFISLLLRAYKWKFLFPGHKELKVSSLFKTVIAGFMVNSILPARAGEVYRAFFLHKLEKISKSKIMGTVVLERVFDGLVVGIGIIFILLLKIIPDKMFYRVGFLGLGVYLFAIVTLVIFYFNKKFVMKIFKKVFFFLSKILMDKLIIMMDRFYEGFHIFKNLKNLIIFILYTVLVWLVICVTDYLFLYSMDIFTIFPMAISPVMFTLLLVCLLVLGVSIPSGPGAIGPFHASIFFAFYLVNPAFVKVNTYEYNVIASLSMYIWIFQIIIFVISGVYVITREHIKLKVGADTITSNGKQT
ncbi:MAG: flippase-like domain-containing protein [Spirochaetes bacterium]|nr:flippase-like domain-containing protein [Spirochaetota bacterium]